MGGACFSQRPGPFVVEFSAVEREDEYTRLRQGQEQGNFWDLIVEMRSDPTFEPVDLTRGEIDSWRDHRPTREFEWPE